jgi:hypothetical protein
MYRLVNLKANHISIFVNIMRIMVYKNLVKKVRKTKIFFPFYIYRFFLYLGISLAVDQWEKLKTLVNQVDKDLKKSK